MTSGWLTVAVALIGALSTLGAVIYSQRAAERREIRADGQTAAGRAFELERAERQASWERSQSLVDRMIEAHVQLLRVFERAVDVAGRQLFQTDPDPGPGEEWEDVFVDIAERRALVAILASPAAGEAAEGARVATVKFMNKPTMDAWDVQRAAVQVYREAIRTDLRAL